MKFALNRRYLNPDKNLRITEVMMEARDLVRRPQATLLLWILIGLMAFYALLLFSDRRNDLRSAASSQYASDSDAMVYTYEIVSPQGSKLVEMTTFDVINYISAHPGTHAVKVSQ